MGLVTAVISDKLVAKDLRALFEFCQHRLAA